MIADGVQRLRGRVASVAEPLFGTDREDITMLIHEAERQLQIAGRSLERAIKAVGRG